MKRILSILAIAFFAVCASARTGADGRSFRVSGKITDKTNGKPIAGASVIMPGSEVFPAPPDSAGFFSVLVPSGMACLEFVALGYVSKSIEVNVEDDMAIDIEMELAPGLDDRAVSRLLRLKRYEFDGKFYNCFGVSSNKVGSAMAMFGLEGRYNLRRVPAGVGLGFSYVLPFVMDYEVAEGTPLGTVTSFSYWMVYAAFDYSIIRGRIFRIKNNAYVFEPYVGMAAGGGRGLTKTVAGFDDESYAIEAGKSKAIANLTLRAGFKVNQVRLFFEGHFNSDKARGSYFGVTYFF